LLILNLLFPAKLALRHFYIYRIDETAFRKDSTMRKISLERRQTMQVSFPHIAPHGEVGEFPRALHVHEAGVFQFLQMVRHGSGGQPNPLANARATGRFLRLTDFLQHLKTLRVCHGLAYRSKLSIIESHLSTIHNKFDDIVQGLVAVLQAPL